MGTPAFLTGSRAYGKPKKKSDIDLVVFMDEETESLLKELSEDDNQLRFGRLNIISIKTATDYDNWKKATDELKAMAADHGPVTRETAVAHLKSICGDKAGCSGA